MNLAVTPWLLASDIHFDPYADPNLVDALVAAPAAHWREILARHAASPAAFGKDTNFTLLESALDAMRANDPNPPVVVVTGDFLAHDYLARFNTLEKASPAAYAAFVDKTFAFLASEMNARFPDAQFVIAVGNNDGYCDDYRSTPDSPFLANEATVWEPLVNRRGAAADFVKTFARGGYYTTSLPGIVPAQAVVLNGVFWSSRYENACGERGSDPGTAELEWLATTAAISPGTYRWFVSHIPPGIDAYSSLKKKAPVPFMCESYEQRLLAIVDDPRSRASAFLLGHEHHESYQIVGPGDGTGIPGFVIPSISAIQGNNPAFATADVDPATGTVRDIVTYAYHFESALPQWTREYAFKSAYNVLAFDTDALARVQSELERNVDLRATFAAYYASSSVKDAILPADWPWYWCANTQLFSAAYAACVANARIAPHPTNERGGGIFAPADAR